jgi:hypothetical protein
MSDGPTPGDHDAAGGDVGSVADEAAKLLGALQDWARTATEGSPPGAADGFGAAFRHVDEHVASADGSCAYCPVCQVITRVRATSPEVRVHLAVAARSLLEAAAALLETQVPPEPRRSGVQRIDLDDEGDGGSAAEPGWDAD